MLQPIRRTCCLSDRVQVQRADAADTLSRRRFVQSIVSGLAVATVGCKGRSHRNDPAQTTIALPGRHSVVADHFVIMCDVQLDWTNPLIAELNELRDDVAESLQLVPSSQPVVVYLFSDERQFADYMRTTWPDLPYRRAWFFGNPYELAVYTFWGDRVQEDLRHEFTHGVLHGALKEVPLWIDEGLAEYFEISGRPGVVRPATSKRLSEALANGWRPNMERLEQITDVRKMSQSDYEESWAWAHYMLHSGTESKAILLSWLQELATRANPELLSNRLKREGLASPDRFASYVAGLNTFGIGSPPPVGV